MGIVREALLWAQVILLRAQFIFLMWAVTVQIEDITTMQKLQLYYLQKKDELEAQLQRLDYAPSETPQPAQAATVERQAHPERRERQDQVKKLWADGRTIEEMAKTLSVSVATVKRDLKSLGLRQK